MLSLLALLSVSHVPVRVVVDGGGAAVYAPARVRAGVDRDVNVRVVFQDLAGGGGGWVERSSTDAGKTAVAYFGREAYVVALGEAGSGSYASLAAFGGGRGATLAPDSIEFGAPKYSGAAALFAESAGPCPSLRDCAFRARARGAASDTGFAVSVGNAVHYVPQAWAGKRTAFEGAGTSVVVDARDYNTHVALPPSGGADAVPVLSFVRLGLLLHYNGSHYSLWEDEPPTPASNLVSMALVLIGGTVFIPSSVALTRCARARPPLHDEGVGLIGGAGSIMHVLVADFAFTAASVTFFLVLTSGVGWGTFRTSRRMDTPAWVDVLILANTAACVAVATVGAVACRAAVEARPGGQPSLFTRLHRGGPATLVHAVAARLAFEYILIITFMAAAPFALGHGFAQCLYLLSAGSMLFVVGRDMAIIDGLRARRFRRLAAGRAAMAVATAMAGVPFVHHGIVPIVRDSHSFPSTTLVTYTVSVAMGLVLTFTGAAAGRATRPARK